MANRHLFGHRNLEAMEFTGDEAWESLGECAAWLLAADHFEHAVDIISTTTYWDTENMGWVTTLVYDDAARYGKSSV